MSYVHDIAEVAHPGHRQFYPEMKMLNADTLSGLRSGFAEQLGSFEEELHSVMGLVDKGEELVLRVPKIDVETWADTGPRVDCEVLTEAPETGKKKVAPPAKGAKGSNTRKKAKG
jgi:hypothetical protein